MKEKKVSLADCCIQITEVCGGVDFARFPHIHGKPQSTIQKRPKRKYYQQHVKVGERCLLVGVTIPICVAD